MMTRPQLSDEEIERAERHAKLQEQIERARFSKKRFLDVTPNLDLVNPQALAAMRGWPSLRAPAGGALLVGPPGTGKSFAAQLILRYAIERGMTAIRITEHEYGFALIKRDERQLRNAARRRDVLLLDDLGSEYQTAFLAAEIDAVVDSRWDRGAATIVTSNLVPWRQDAGDDSLEARYPRIWSRLRHDGPGLIVFSGPDLRLERDRR